MRYVVTAGRPDTLLISAYGPFPDLESTLAFIASLEGQVSTYHELNEQPSDVVDGRITGQDADRLAGTAEVAQILEVSRQRVSQLARTPGFPAMIAKLAATPVWRADEVAHYGHHRFDP